MSFENKIKDFAQRIDRIQENITNEESTKTSVVMPLFQLLGYDVFDPEEFVPEFTADVGIKKGEKVDYAIINNGEPLLLIEVKALTEKLSKHDSQLFRYFGTTSAKFAILTNGIDYKFFTDLEEKNKMDSTPFLELNLLDMTDSEVSELQKFHKQNFDVDEISDTASDLKYSGMIKKIIKEEFTEPSDDFLRFLLSEVYYGVKTQNVLDKFRPIALKTIKQYIGDLVNEKIKNALTPSKDTGDETITESDIPSEMQEAEEVPDDTPKIITTEDELQSYYVVKSILGGAVDLNRIAYRDTLSYFGILLDDNRNKWICRVYLKDTVNYVITLDPEGNSLRFEIDSIDDIYTIKPALIERLNCLL